MSEPDWRAMGDPLNDRLPPKQTAASMQCSHGGVEPIVIACEGSNYVGHPIWRGDLLGPAVMCQMCGQDFPPADTFDRVPDHTRPDLIAMIDRGDFNG